MKRAGLLLLMVEFGPLDFVQVVRPEEINIEEENKKIPPEKAEEATDKEQKDKEQA